MLNTQHCIVTLYATFSEVKIVKSMPIQTGEKPTVAIITSKYYEKLAVDSMMTNKTTFVKYKTEGTVSAYKRQWYALLCDHPQCLEVGGLIREGLTPGERI